MEIEPYLTSIVKAIVDKFQTSVQLIVLYGSSASQTRTKFSDIDIYVIFEKPIVDENEPDTSWSNLLIFEKGILNSVDIYETTFEKLEKRINPEELVWCVGNRTIEISKILYSKNEDSRKKFEELVEKSKNYKKIENIHQLSPKELEILFNSFRDVSYGNLKIIEENMNNILRVKCSVWAVLNDLCSRLALINKKPFSSNWGACFPLIFKTFTVLPENFEETVTKIIENDDSKILAAQLKRLIQNSEKLFLEIQKKQLKENSKLNGKLKKEQQEKWTKFIYPGIYEYMNKIRSARVKNDVFSLSYAVCELSVLLPTELLNLMLPACNFNCYNLNDFREVIENYKNELNEVEKLKEIDDLLNSLIKFEKVGIIEEILEDLENKLDGLLGDLEIEINKVNSPEELYNYILNS